MTQQAHCLNLTLTRGESRSSVAFEVRRVINVGFAGRDQAAVKAHIQELAEEGVPPPPTVPMLFPVLRSSLTTDHHIEVASAHTSGEVEPVLLVQGDRILVGVGSDHTDRALEATDMLASKQVCANVLGDQVWDYHDIADHWDDLILESWITFPAAPRDDAKNQQPYQQSPLSSLLAVDDLLKLIRSKLRHADADGLVIFGGTVPIRGGQTVYSNTFRCALRDPIRDRQITCAYEVHDINHDLRLPSPASRDKDRP